MEIKIMADKNYLDSLKILASPKKIKLKERTEVFLQESKIQKPKVLKEIFVQSSEIASMEQGVERDRQILRLAIIAELDASNLYEKLSALAENDAIKEILLDVSKEEKTHVGEFHYALKKMDEEYDEEIDTGEEEVEDMTDEEDFDIDENF